MDVLEKLKQDHENIKEKISILAETIQKLETGMVSYLKREVINIDEFLEFFRKFVDSHFKIEEEIIFPELEKHGADKKFLSSLLDEHKVIREMIFKFQATVESGINIEDENTKKEIIRIIELIIQKLSIHAEKEDSKLIPLAQQVLRKEEK